MSGLVAPAGVIKFYNFKQDIFLKKRIDHQAFDALCRGGQYDLEEAVRMADEHRDRCTACFCSCRKQNLIHEKGQKEK